MTESLQGICAQTGQASDDKKKKPNKPNNAQAFASTTDNTPKNEAQSTVQQTVQQVQPIQPVQALPVQQTPTNDLSEGLRQMQAILAAMAAPAMASKAQNSWGPTPAVKTQALQGNFTPLPTQSKARLKPCILCHGDHWASECSAYSQLNARIARAKELFRCTHCLSPMHEPDQCNSPP
uniref:Gag-like protein n=1 Tax=Ditylenchus dipsaci TaxID=166011 RepID=A0A915CW10_9BILA